MSDPDDAWSLLQRRRQRAAGLPVVTGIDRSGRTELSATSLENAAAKIANALRDEFDLEPGSVVGIDLPVHWQRTAWCAGAWTAGCAVAIDVESGAVARADLVVASADRAQALVEAGAPAVQAVSLHPFGLPIVEPLPAGVSDVTLVVRQQPDAYLFEPPHGALPALQSADGSLTQAEALDEARRLARSWGLAADGRLLVGPDLDPVPSWLAALAVPLAADASVVLTSIGDPDGRIAGTERVTTTAR
jgi:uncharacterized protein (TIGR03089 family)